LDLIKRHGEVRRYLFRPAREQDTTTALLYE
jgi:hypothetical protein